MKISQALHNIILPPSTLDARATAATAPTAIVVPRMPTVEPKLGAVGVAPVAPAAPAAPRRPRVGAANCRKTGAPTQITAHSAAVEHIRAVGVMLTNPWRELRILGKETTTRINYFQYSVQQMFMPNSNSNTLNTNNMSIKAPPANP